MTREARHPTSKLKPLRTSNPVRVRIPLPPPPAFLRCHAMRCPVPGPTTMRFPWHKGMKANPSINPKRSLDSSEQSWIDMPGERNERTNIPSFYPDFELSVQDKMPARLGEVISNHNSMASQPKCRNKRLVSGSNRATARLRPRSSARFGLSLAAQRSGGSARLIVSRISSGWEASASHNRRSWRRSP